MPNHGIYQSWSWADFQTALGVRTRRLALFRGDRVCALAAVELRRLRRLPYCTAYAPRGPLWREPEDFLHFTKALSTFLRPYGALVLKVNPQRPQADGEILRAAGFKEMERPDLPLGGVLSPLASHIDVSAGEESAFRALHPNTRRRVRRSRDRGIVIRLASDDRDGHAAYALIAETARARRFALMPEPSFLRLWRIWQERQCGALFLALVDGEICGATLASFFGGEAQGHFVADDGRHRKDSIVQALYWTVIAHGCRRGCKVVDLGAIGSGEDDHLQSFKRQFGGQPTRFVGEWNKVLMPAAYGLMTVLSRGRLARRL